jgi:putative flavoprotein involved in K+ transport
VRTTTVVIGAGHGGLAMSRCLSERSIDHVVLERSDVANSWRTERWDSLRLLTPNWLCRLPGYTYHGDDPDGFMAADEVVEFITRYAAEIGAPVLTGTTVTSVRRTAGGYCVTTDHDEWHCPTVVVATGAFSVPYLPAVSEAVPAAVTTLTPKDYRNPDELVEGGVLVVGASATGVQLAHEIQRSGRPVTLAVGEHVRGPRTYRGWDILWWMEAAGVLAERYDEVDDIVRARRVPSMQLAGSPDTFDLNALTGIGVTLVGRLVGIRDGRGQFSGSLRNKCDLADLKLDRLLDAVDEWATATGIDDAAPPSHRFAPTFVPEPPTLDLDLAGGAIRTIIWATGFRPDYSWLDVGVLDEKGMLRHDGGVVESPGMYVIGSPFLRRRKSSFMDGAREDAQDLIVELASYLDRQAVPTTPRHRWPAGLLGS